MKHFFTLLLLCNLTLAFAGNFTPGNIVVARVGSGSTLLTSAAQPVFLDEYSRVGTLVQTLALPTVTSGSNHPFSLSGTATSEGTLTLAANGQYLVLAGYDAVPGTFAVVGDSTINRVIARIGTNGVANTSTGILAGAAYYKDNVRAAASSDGTKFWLAGNGVNDSGGTYYLPFGSFTNAPVKISSSPNNTRTVSIFNNQLYISSQTNTFNGVSIVGSGLPANTGNASTMLPGFTAPSSFSVYSFWLFDMNPNVAGMDVLYFCDDRDIAPNGGLYKYSLVNGTWVSNGNVPVPNNLKGITAERTCFTQIFCSSGTRIFSLRDNNGYNESISGTLTQIAMAATNTKFRGIAFAPGTQTLTALQVTASATNVSCFNAGNGSIALSVSGGVSPYSYNWGNGITTQNRNNLSPGAYQVTVTDANSCTATASATITQPAQLSVSASKTDVSCNGGNNGSITLTVNGGTPNYTFNWNGGATAQNRNNLSAGTYSVTITDSKGCTAIASVTIAQPAALSASTSKTNVSCNGGSNGAVTLSVSGGTTSYTFNWSNNATTQNLNSLSAGIYSVTVTDARSCTATASSTITQPVALSVSTTQTNVSCNGGANGSVDLTVSGGITPYSYNWTNNAQSQDVGNLSAGIFNVTVQDANGCSATTGVTIAQPTALSASIAKTNVSCNGGNNGAANLSVAGGTTPYSYSWSNNASSEDINSLTAGIYNVTITDANNCSFTSGTTITQPFALSLSLTKTNASCNAGNNGSIDLSVSGGMPSYTYQWTNNAVTQDLNNLSANTYTITVTDANNCSTTSGATITEPTLLIATIVKTEVRCNGENDGAIDLAVSGGVNPYVYVWSNNATTQDVSSLRAATYNITITDANNCTIETGATITQPTVLAATVTKEDAVCNGTNTGSIDLSVSGGILPYSYNWSNNATTQDIGSLSAAAYQVTITDANSCSSTNSAILSEPTAIVISPSITNASCNGGTNGAINITVTGGIPAYTYAWNTGASSEDLTSVSAGLYQVTVADDNGCVMSKSITVGESSALAITLIEKTDLTCNAGNNGAIDIEAAGGVLPYIFNWSNGASTEDITGLASGNHTVTVSDANNCSKVENYSVNAAPVLITSISRRNTSCNSGNDGSANLTVSGGATPYHFVWSNGDSTEDASALSAGIYAVTITDVNGCSASTGTIISEPSAITASLATTAVKCFGGNDGAIDLSVSGGTTPYTHHWSNNASSQDAGNLSTGIYTVTITDVKGCADTATATIAEPIALAASPLQTNVRCNGGNDGALEVSMTGGVAPYSYDWSHGAAQKDITGLSAGNYSLTVQDANNCAATASAVISEPALLFTTISKTDVRCFGGNDATATLTTIGGTAGYGYNWSQGASTQIISELTVGNYSVTVTDNNGCSAIDGVTITQPSAISITALVTNPPCSGGNEGALDITVSGGTSGYAYLWSNNAATEDLTNLSADNYSVTVTDGNSCTEIFSAAITQSGTLEVLTAASNVSCNGLNEGTITLFVNGGTPGYTYLWSNGDSIQNINNLPAGIFAVTVTDVNGCSLVETVSIAQPAQLEVLIDVTDITCFGAGNGSIDLTVSGGSSPYSFNWANGATTEEVITLIAGNYSMTITDDNLCSAISSADITEPDLIELEAAVTDASAVGVNDGSIALTVTGGTPGYTFNWASGESQADIFQLPAGNYCVTVTDERACVISTCYTVSEPVSTGDFDLQENISVVTDAENIWVKMRFSSVISGTIRIFDITGKALFQHQLQPHLSLQIPVEQLASGIFVVNIVSDKGFLSKKIALTR